MSNADPNAERDAEVRRWVRYAQEDLRAAEGAAREAAADLRAAEAAAREAAAEVFPQAPVFVPRHACTDAQQAAEKAIKAVLIYRGVSFKKIHDLDALRNLIPDPASWSITREPLASSLDLARLTLWAVASRYPGEGSEPDADDATTAIATAREVVDSVVDDLPRNGFALTPPG